MKRKKNKRERGRRRNTRKYGERIKIDAYIKEQREGEREIGIKGKKAK